MIILIVGLLLFVGVHSLRELKYRDRLISRFGSSTYRALFSLVAISGLALIVVGKSQASFTMIYEPVFGLQIISNMLMLPATIMFVGGVLPRSYLQLMLVHPMLVGTIFWAGAHLWANGDLASLLLFGSIGVWALMKLISLIMSSPRPNRKPRVFWDVTSLILGLALYRLLAEYHGQLFGIGIFFA